MVPAAATSRARQTVIPNLQRCWNNIERNTRLSTMKIRFRGHNYQTAFLMRLRWYFVRRGGRNDYPQPVLIGHGMGCCDYWITDPKEIENALRLDDDFKVGS